MNPASSSTIAFPSKVDRWIVWLMALPLGVSAAVVTSALLASPPLPAALLIVGVETLVLGFIAWGFRSTRYLVTGRELVVRSGPFRWRIEISGIESIRPSRSPIASPALSLDRLEIRYGGGRMLLISPRDREGLLAAVVARSRNLVRAGDQVRRDEPLLGPDRSAAPRNFQ
ncbi:MAG TPA: PH domain-containing protein [Thermoanaerobaculia bacterium]|jgi:hypothetical protein